MLDWMGTIFSGLGLVLQLKEKNEKDKWAQEILSILKLASQKLELCKNVHSFYQEMHYQEFESYLLEYDDNSTNDNYDLWMSLFETFKVSYKRYNLDVLIKDEKLNLTEVETEETTRPLNYFNLQTNVKIINLSYPEMIRKINELNLIINDYNDNILKHKEFMSSKHVHINELIKDIIFNADRSMKELIGIFNRMMSGV